MIRIRGLRLHRHEEDQLYVCNLCYDIQEKRLGFLLSKTTHPAQNISIFEVRTQTKRVTSSRYTTELPPIMLMPTHRRRFWPPDSVPAKLARFSGKPRLVNIRSTSCRSCIVSHTSIQASIQASIHNPSQGRRVVARSENTVRKQSGQS